MIARDRRLSSTTACCIAAARAGEAVNLWVVKLDRDEIECVRRSLERKQEWNALAVFNRAVDLTTER